MIGPISAHPFLALAAVTPLVLGLMWVIGLSVKYGPIIGQKFEEPPWFHPLRVVPGEPAEMVEFTAEDGVKLAGSYFPARTDERAGVLVYCHEFLSDRWSYRPYVDSLRDLGFDVFTFDFRGHGASKAEDGYVPMHWASDREVRDLRGALAYLRSRRDHDPAGFGLFGVSRGGTTALLAAPAERDVWGVITDGAFPTTGMMIAYSLRWTELYLRNPILRRMVPRWLYYVLACVGRRQVERRRGCRFPDVERAVARIGPRPWLMIHGERDTYITPAIVKRLWCRGDGPKELWLVPEAKHNRCREREPEAYASHLLDFVDRYAPRRPVTAGPSRAFYADRDAEAETGDATNTIAAPGVHAHASARTY